VSLGRERAEKFVGRQRTEGLENCRIFMGYDFEGGRIAPKAWSFRDIDTGGNRR